MVTECSLLPHTALCYHTLQKVINNRSMSYTKAALQAPGSGDLTNSSASPLCRLTLFPEHHVRTVAINLYISSYTQGPSIISGTVLPFFQEPSCIHIDAGQKDADRVGPICDEKRLSSFTSKRMRNFSGQKKKKKKAQRK